MCELLNRTQGLAKAKGLPIPNCSPDIQAICIETECALEQIMDNTHRALNSRENLNKFYDRLSTTLQIIRGSSPKN